MLTGDKVETAKCIAISAGFKSRVQKFIEFTGITSRRILQDRISREIASLNNTVLVIDGTTLDTVISTPETERDFFEVAKGCPAVLVCRCSPT